jgi:hypothetical protein
MPEASIVVARIQGRARASHGLSAGVAWITPSSQGETVVKLIVAYPLRKVADDYMAQRLDSGPAEETVQLPAIALRSFIPFGISDQGAEVFR